MRKHLKRITLFFGFILALSIITLAFIPHYSCACASKEMPAKAKYDGSLLTYIVRQITRLYA
jgi:hypothetical protein